MGLMFWPVVWLLFMVGLSAAFFTVLMKESRVRAKAAKEALAAQQAMAAANAQMSSNEGAGFDDGFGEDPEFAAFDENAFK